MIRTLFGGKSTFLSLSFAWLLILLVDAACAKEGASADAKLRPLSDMTAPPATAEGGTVRPAAKESAVAPIAPAAQVPEEFLTGAWSFRDSCNIERLNDSQPDREALVIKAGSTLRLTGWAIAERDKRVPSRLFLVFQKSEDGTRWYVPVQERVSRADVAKAKGNPTYAGSGFNIPIDTSPLPHGELHVLLAFRDGGAPVICDNGRKIRVQ